jgi:hypothetical protein
MSEFQRTRPPAPGDTLIDPPFDEWADVLERNATDASDWRFDIGGERVGEFRRRARSEAIDCATGFSRRFGVEGADPPGCEESRVVMTGHQPGLWHPGIWLKVFALDRCAGVTGALGVSLVVDTDGFDSVTASIPVMSPSVARTVAELAPGTRDGCYAGSPVPAEATVDRFCAAVSKALETLPVASPGHCFARFCGCVRAARIEAANLAEFLTIARRRYESEAHTAYLELPVTTLAATPSFSAFAGDIVSRAPEFARAYNTELGEYRAASKTRSKAQPFPDLAITDQGCELPFWILAGGTRTTAWACPVSGGEGVSVGEDPRNGRLPPEPIEPALLVPKALALTLYARMFLADLFIHGTGGGRYDRITDGVMRRFYGVEPPRFAVASASVILPLDVEAPGDAQIAEARTRLGRISHNPDLMLDEAGIEDPGLLLEARGLAAEKALLVAAIGRPDADKKALGASIRRVNEALSEILAPYAEEVRAELADLERCRAEAEILSDRTYPYCFWDPHEIAALSR